VTEISIQFRHAPFQLFRNTPVESLRTNRWSSISSRTKASRSALAQKCRAAHAHGRSGDGLQLRGLFRQHPSTGYERLIYDCMIGDATLFQRADMVEAGWSVITPVLDVWKALPPADFPTMPPDRGDRKRPTICSRVMGVNGERSNEKSWSSTSAART
jgi:glucose-6-phosphate 1-dehydrogenase